MIRHGVAQHNDNFLKYGVRTFYDPKFVDTKLTSIGHLQSKRLNKEWENINNIELVLVSPLYRALETANNIFIKKNIPIISLENLREFPMGKHTCNKRSEKNKLIKDFETINFDNLLSNLDLLWNPTEEETILSLEYRIENIKDFIKGRNETNICIVSHTSFIEMLKDNKMSLIEKGESEIEHCHPYVMEL